MPTNRFQRQWRWQLYPACSVTLPRSPANPPLPCTTTLHGAAPSIWSARYYASAELRRHRRTLDYDDCFLTGTPNEHVHICPLCKDNVLAISYHWSECIEDRDRSVVVFAVFTYRDLRTYTHTRMSYAPRCLLRGGTPAYPLAPFSVMEVHRSHPNTLVRRCGRVGRPETFDNHMHE